jgi:hypothetical protein
MRDILQLYIQQLSRMGKLIPEQQSQERNSLYALGSVPSQFAISTSVRGCLTSYGAFLSFYNSHILLPYCIFMLLIVY